MKKTFFSLLLVAAFFKTHAQFELKANPIALLFGAAGVAAEFPLSEDWGLEADVLIFDEGGWVYGLGKYYFSPKYGADRFHIGAFAGSLFDTYSGGESTFGIGFMLGYKVVSAKNFIFDVGLGGGRALINSDYFEALGYGKLAIGYRFSGKSGRGKE